MFVLVFEIFVKSGGAGDRSRCLLHAKQALYHLSYTPDENKLLLLVIETSKIVNSFRRSVIHLTHSF